MISDVDVAELCNDIYTRPERFDKIINVDRVYIGVKEYLDCTVLIGRGTCNLADGLRDLEAIGLIHSDTIGDVPLGFYIGIPAVFSQIKALNITMPIVLGGHSLGAAHAAQIGGCLIPANKAPARTVLFGCPTPGGARLKWLYSGHTIVSYRNMDDPVTIVPLLPGLTRIVDFTHLSTSPESDDDLGVLAPHRMKYYYEGVQKLFK